MALDRHYILPTDAEVREVVADFVRGRGAFVYVPERNDCDNAAIELLNHMRGKGWAFGLALVPGHALNLYVNDQREIRFVEPQTGTYPTSVGRLELSLFP